MKLVHFDWNPPAKQLRQFGFAALIFLPILGWLISGGELAVFLPFVGVGATFALLGLFAPNVLKPIFVVASLITFPIGLVLGEALLLIIYYVVVTPVALFFRLIGRDALDRKIDRSAKSYWIRLQPVTDVQSYYRQS